MPIYEFRCRACGHQIEVIQKVDDRRPRKCERCSGKLEKLVSRTAFLLKGGGWYTEGYTKGTKGSKKDDSAKGAKDAGDSKPKKQARSAAG